MELVIPDGAQVHITIGQAPTLALSHDNPALQAKPDYRSGRIAKGLLAGVVLFGAFQAGRFLPHHPDSALAAQPAASVGTLDGGSAAEIPPAFRAQMGNAWLEKTAGQTNVTQAVSYQGSTDGAYREARHAEVRTVYRVDWNDLTSLIEGEAIVLFGGRRIYARVFHAKIDGTGVKRVGRTLVLRPPDRKDVIARHKRSRVLGALIEAGAVVGAPPEPIPPELKAFVRAFSLAAAEGGDGHACVRAAVEAIAELAEHALPERPTAPADGVPITSLRPMMFTASQHVFACPDLSGAPNEPVDDKLLRAIGNIERAAGIAYSKTRGAALVVLGTRDAVLADTPGVEPPVMTQEDFEKVLSTILIRIEKLRSPALQQAA